MISNYTRIETAGIFNENQFTNCFVQTNYRILEITKKPTESQTILHHSCNLIKYMQHIATFHSQKFIWMCLFEFFIHLNIEHWDQLALKRTLQSNNTSAPMFTEKDCKMFGALSLFFLSNFEICELKVSWYESTTHT